MSRVGWVAGTAARHMSEYETPARSADDYSGMWVDLQDPGDPFDDDVAGGRP